MKIVLAADIAGFDLKESIKEHLTEKGHIVFDVGMLKKESFVWWYEGCANAVGMIQAGKAELGILICGTGAGMCAYANKHKGIFAVACESIYTARQCRHLLDANVMTMGGHIVGRGMALEMVDVFIKTKFADGVTTERREYLEEQKEKFVKLDAACFISR
ncbi:MAG: RpiB/LacA/LacB family sugar-phosphate isomerase [Acetivibrionales bacterium]|jgi:ribose 5-phosphate isomerase B